jgi:endonuclease-3 related protein
MAHAALARPAIHGLVEVYERLRRHRGPAGWWPAETPFEVCVGAILVQNTAWANAEKALRSLRAAGRLTYEGLARLGQEELAALIRPSGCYNVKAKRLAAFLDFLGREYGGSVEAMAAQEPLVLREQLLGVRGIGRETADSIVLYAAGLPLFVVDAYTRRVFGRLGVIRGDESYDALQDRFMSELPSDAALFNDFHAQIVMHAKDVCRPRPDCGRCSLETLCPKVGLRV